MRIPEIQTTCHAIGSMILVCDILFLWYRPGRYPFVILRLCLWTPGILYKLLLNFNKMQHRGNKIIKYKISHKVSNNLFIYLLKIQNTKQHDTFKLD